MKRASPRPRSQILLVLWSGRKRKWGEAWPQGAARVEGTVTKDAGGCWDRRLLPSPRTSGDPSSAAMPAPCGPLCGFHGGLCLVDAFFPGAMFNRCIFARWSWGWVWETTRWLFHPSTVAPSLLSGWERSHPTGISQSRERVILRESRAG